MASMAGAAEHMPWFVATCAAVAALYSFASPGRLQDWLSRLLPSSAVTAEDLQADPDHIPDEFRDPITFDIMTDPVVLCATGQVYDHTSLRQWFQAGNFRCPKTNLDVHDAHVTRLPWLKHNILDWLKQHQKPLPAEPYPTLADIETFQPQLAVCIKGIRSDTGVQRSAAAAALVRQLRKWMDSTAADDLEAQQQQVAVRSAIMDDMLWMVRYGDEYLQGVAASVLACCCLDEELSWLAATAIVPLVALLHSGNNYSQEWSLQTLYKICLQVPSSRPILWRAGCVQGLLQLLSADKSHVPFHRDRAAVMLATMAHDTRVKSWLQLHGVLPLVKMFLESSDRWEQRDAAFALLALQLNQSALQLAAAAVVAHNPDLLCDQYTHNHNSSTLPEGSVSGNSNPSSEGSSSSSCRQSAPLLGTPCIDEQPSSSGRGNALAPDCLRCKTVVQQQGSAKLDRQLLARYRWCSQKYLDGQIDEPDSGLTEQETAMRDSYEAALAQYRHAHEDHIEDVDHHHHQQQQQQQGVGAQPDNEPEPMLPNAHDQQEQQDGDVQVANRQQHGEPQVLQQQQQQQRPRRRNNGQRLGMHWMAEHDADGDSDSAADSETLAAGSSSGSSGADMSGSSSDSGDAAIN